MIKTLLAYRAYVKRRRSLIKRIDFGDYFILCDVLKTNIASQFGVTVEQLDDVINIANNRRISNAMEYYHERTNNQRSAK